MSRLSNPNPSRKFQRAHLRLHISGPFIGVAVVPDDEWPAMWRVRTPDGRLSDMVNLARARDAAVAHAHLGGDDVASWHTRETPLEAATPRQTARPYWRPPNERRSLNPLFPQADRAGRAPHGLFRQCEARPSRGSRRTGPRVQSPASGTRNLPIRGRGGRRDHARRVVNVAVTHHHRARTKMPRIIKPLAPARTAGSAHGEQWHEESSAKERRQARADEERIERIFETQNECWPGNSPPDDDDAYNVQHEERGG
jgi:hypothetical protein